MSFWYCRRRRRPLATCCSRERNSFHAFYALYTLKMVLACLLAWLRGNGGDCLCECVRERENYLKYLKKSLFARWLKRKNKCLCREYSVALWGVLLLHCWPPVLLVWTQLFWLCCWSSNIYTCLIISKQVTHEVCCTVILSLTKYFSVVCNGEMQMYLILATWSSLVEGNGWLGSAQFTNKFGYCPWQTMSIVLAFRIC